MGTVRLLLFFSSIGKELVEFEKRPYINMNSKLGEEPIKVRHLKKWELIVLIRLQHSCIMLPKFNDPFTWP